MIVHLCFHIGPFSRYVLGGQRPRSGFRPRGFVPLSVVECFHGEQQVWGGWKTGCFSFAVFCWRNLRDGFAERESRQANWGERVQLVLVPGLGDIASNANRTKKFGCFACGRILICTLAGDPRQDIEGVQGSTYLIPSQKARRLDPPGACKSRVSNYLLKGFVPSIGMMRRWEARRPRSVDCRQIQRTWGAFTSPNSRSCDEGHYLKGTISDLICITLLIIGSTLHLASSTRSRFQSGQDAQKTWAGRQTQRILDQLGIQIPP